MKPFFFGSRERQLFGVYHAPSGRAVRDAAVLLCYPGVQEYNVTHWAFRRLAAMLAREGFHVMRFDWSASGDSAGDVRDARVAHWVEDVSMAVRELRATSAANALSIVGMRLGGAIATLACANGLKVGDLALWEPVVRGSHYVDELEVLDAEQNQHLLHALPVERHELVGFPFPPALRDEIAKIDLRLASPRGAERVAVFASEAREDHRALCDALATSGRTGGYSLVREDSGVTNAGAAQSALLSNKILIAITKHLTGTGA